jgi:hypothetical protein
MQRPLIPQTDKAGMALARARFTGTAAGRVVICLGAPRSKELWVAAVGVMTMGRLSRRLRDTASGGHAVLASSLQRRAVGRTATRMSAGM